MNLAFILFMCTCTQGLDFDVVKSKSIDYRHVEILKINNHTYLHYRNIWNPADSAHWHDPDCTYCQEKINKELSKLKMNKEKGG